MTSLLYFSSDQSCEIWRINGNIQFRVADCRRKALEGSGGDIVLMSVGVALFFLAFVVARRAFLAGEPALAIPAAAAAALFLGLAARPVFRIARRSDDGDWRRPRFSRSSSS